jgi:O-antigen polymerase
MLAVLFLVAPVYYHPNIGGEGLRVPNNITVWMMATIIIGYSLHLVLKRPTFVIPKYFAYFAAFPILITLSGFVTGVEQPLTWLFRLLFIWGGLAFFFSLFQHKLKQGRLDRILVIIVVSALLQGLVGIAQIWLQADMPFWLPKSPNGVPSGLFQQINNQATYQVTSIMIVAYLITRPFISFAKPWLKAILILAVLCASFLVAVSGSRIGALTLILGLLIIIPTQWHRFKQRKKMALIATVALVMGIGLSSVGGNGHAIDKTVAMQSGYSGESRIGIYTIALNLIKQQPVFGHGVGSFGRVFQYARPDFYKTHTDAVLPQQYVSHPHNETLFWLVEGGLIAGVGLLAVFIGVILALKKLGWQRGGAYAAMLLPIGLHTQVELPFYMSGLHWFVFIVLLVMINRHQASNIIKNITVSLSRFINGILITLFIVLMVFFAHTLRSNWDFVAFYKGEQNDNPLPYAHKNPYLADQARWIDMSAMMYSSIEYGQTKNVEYYVNWAEKLLLEKPDADLYGKLVDGYQFLGNKTAYCASAERGLTLYPQAKRLQLAKEFCQY